MIKFQEGTPDTMIERLRDAISGFDRKWAGKCRPATEKQIQRLENIVKKYHWELPDAYLRYLRAMGKNDAGLLENEWDGCEPGIDAILKLFEGSKNDSSVRRCLKEGNFLFSYNWGGSNFYLRLSETKADPPVVESVFANPEGKYVAGSFEKYLFRQAFKMYQETFKYHVSSDRSLCNHEEKGKEDCRTCSVYGETAKERMETALQVTQAYGLEGAWFGDRVQYFWYDERYALIINVRDGFRIEFSYNDAALKEQFEWRVLDIRKTQEWLYQLISSQ